MIALAGLLLVAALISVACYATVMAALFMVGFLLIVLWALIPVIVVVGIPAAIIYRIYVWYQNRQ
jgi:cytochrome c oxidase assembly factor CtaG